MAKKKDNTGFRNGELFCFHCGERQAMPGLPMRASLFAGFLLLFSKEHRNCVKSWQEPHWDETAGMTLDQRKKWWWDKADRGESSIAMYYCFDGMPGRQSKLNATPSDPSDFYRCYFLMKVFPEWVPHLVELKRISPLWGNIVDNWEKLCKMIEEQMVTKKDNGMYSFMKEIGC